MPQIYIVMFNNVKSYGECKDEVLANGGSIKDDLGETLMGFTAVMPDALVQLIMKRGLTDSGIASFEPDKEVTIQI